MPERLESEVVHKVRYINTLTILFVMSFKHIQLKMNELKGYDVIHTQLYSPKHGRYKI